MSVALSKINSFVKAVAEKKFNLGSDQLKIALTNTAHTSTWSVFADLTPINTANLVGATPLNITTTSSAQTSGTYKLVLADLTLTSSGGSVGPFRYIYLYDDTATNKDLIAYYDYGSTVTLDGTVGDQFVIDFDATNGVIQIA